MSDDDVLNPKKRGLGRGLNALFEDDEGVYPQVDAEGQTPGRKRDMMAVEYLRPGASQPRIHFDDDALNELADSIKEHGVLQPLLVRESSDQIDMFDIIAGERRWRAAQKAELHEVPVIVLNITDEEAMQLALIENLQREDLNPLEEAEAISRLLEDHDYTQDKLAKALGKSRSYIANMARLVGLPYEIQAYVREGKISAGHARALLTVDDPLSLAQQIVARGLNVRQTEALVAEEQGREKPASAASSKPKAVKDADTIALENDLTNSIGMRVTIDSKSAKSGFLKIEYKDLNQLDSLIEKLSDYGGGTKRLLG